MTPQGRPISARHAIIQPTLPAQIKSWNSAHLVFYQYKLFYKINPVIQLIVIGHYHHTSLDMRVDVFLYAQDTELVVF
jgi:hypothetical protein